MSTSVGVGAGINPSPDCAVPLLQMVGEDEQAMKKASPPRTYFVDWLRSLVVFIVVSIHVIVSLGFAGDGSTPLTRYENGNWSEKVESTIRMVLQVGMPLLFYFSGRAASFNKDKPMTFFWKKVYRLALPTATGMFLVVIPSFYIGRKYRDFNECPTLDGPPPDGFFAFYGYYFRNFQCGGLAWLWFLMMLFALAMVNIFFFDWVKIRYNNPTMRGLTNRVDARYLVPHAALLAGMLVLTLVQGVLVWWWVMTALAYALVVLLVVRIDIVRFYCMSNIFRWSCVVPTLAMALMQMDAGVNQYIAMGCYHNLNYLAGFLDQLMDVELLQQDERPASKRFRPFYIFYLLCMVGFTSPGVALPEGEDLFVYPVHSSDRWLRLVYVWGTWVWIPLMSLIGRYYVNEKFHERFYFHIMNSCMVTYLVHWIFVDTIESLLVWPFRGEEGMPFFAAVLIVVPLAYLCCAVFYILILKVPFIGLFFGFAKPKSKRKEAKQLEQVMRKGMDAVAETFHDVEAKITGKHVDIHGGDTALLHDHDHDLTEVEVESEPSVV